MGQRVRGCRPSGDLARLAQWAPMTPFITLSLNRHREWHRTTDRVRPTKRKLRRFHPCLRTVCLLHHPYQRHRLRGALWSVGLPFRTVVEEDAEGTLAARRHAWGTLGSIVTLCALSKQELHEETDIVRYFRFNIERSPHRRRFGSPLDAHQHREYSGPELTLRSLSTLSPRAYPPSATAVGQYPHGGRTGFQAGRNRGAGCDCHPLEGGRCGGPRCSALGAIEAIFIPYVPWDGISAHGDRQPSNPRRPWMVPPQSDVYSEFP